MPVKATQKKSEGKMTANRIRLLLQNLFEVAVGKYLREPWFELCYKIMLLFCVCFLQNVSVFFSSFIILPLVDILYILIFSIMEENGIHLAE